jgi:hypothetical protein
MKSCPRCELLHPDDTNTCECGIDFRFLQDHRELCTFLRSASSIAPFRSKVIGYAIGGIVLLAYRSAPLMPLVAILAAGFASDYGEGTQRLVISAAVGIAVLVVWITLLLLRQRILRFARQLVTRPAVAGLQKDCRAPIVYLRPFERDVKGRDEDSWGFFALHARRFYADWRIVR